MSSGDNANQAQSAQRQIPLGCPGHTRPLAEVQFLAVKENGNTDESRILLVSACHDKMPMMRDGLTGDWIGTFEGHKGAVWSTCLDPQGCLAATASGDFSCRVWDAITGDCLYVLPHKHIVKCVAFSKDSKLLATGGHEGLLRIYNLQKIDASFGVVRGNKKPQEIKVEPDQATLQIAQEEQEKVVITKCLWLDNETVLAACKDGNIRVWSIAGNLASLKQTIRVAPKVEIRDMELSLSTIDSKPMHVLTVAAGSNVSFYSVDGTLLKRWKMPMHFRDEGGASLHPSGKTFISGGSDLWVRVFDYETGKELECNKGHHGPIRCLRYAPGGETYATGSEDGTIRLWKSFP